MNSAGIPDEEHVALAFRRDDGVLVQSSLEQVVVADIAASLQAAVQVPTITAIEGELVSRASAQQLRPVILHLLWSGRLHTDLSVALSGASQVRVA